MPLVAMEHFLNLRWDPHGSAADRRAGEEVLRQQRASEADQRDEVHEPPWRRPRIGEVAPPPKAATMWASAAWAAATPPLPGSAAASSGALSSAGAASAAATATGTATSATASATIIDLTVGESMSAAASAEAAATATSTWSASASTVGASAWAAASSNVVLMCWRVSSQLTTSACQPQSRATLASLPARLGMDLLQLPTHTLGQDPYKALHDDLPSLEGIGVSIHTRGCLKLHPSQGLGFVGSLVDGDSALERRLGEGRRQGPQSGAVAAGLRRREATLRRFRRSVP